MLAHKQDKTTLLPQALRERIEEHAGPSNVPNASTHSHNSYLKPFKKGKSRKATREEERAAKKQRKADYFAQRPHIKEKIKLLKRKGDEHSNERPVKRRKVEEGASLVGKNRKQTQKEVNTSGASKFKRRETNNALEPLPLDTIKRKPTQKTKASPSGTKSVERHIKIPTLSTFENEEDKEIAWLEYQLGIGSSKKAGRSSTSYSKLLREDELDDLLEGLDGISSGADEESDAESEFGSQEDDVSEDNSEEGEIADGESDDDVEEEDAIEPGFEGSIESVEEQNGQSELSATAVKLSQTERTTTSKYIPPHLRGGSTGDDPNRIRLLRQLKGLINRLSEQNIGTVIAELEQVYRQNTRYDVSSSLASVIIDAISSNTSLLDNHIALNASLVAALYRIVGIEFAAYFVQEVVKGYEAAYGNVANQQQDASDADAIIVGKDAQNLLVCIAELYNFEVVSCLLMYDIVRALLKQRMGELEVELLLKILRIGGRQLRQDDPLALKDIVQLVTENIASQKGDLSSRTRFMVETLTNLKNNRIKKTDSSGVYTIERMKKVLSGLSKKHHGSHEPLRVTLADLRSVDSKGKWWLVNSGWGGDPLADIQRAKETGSSTGRNAAEGVGSPLKNSKPSKSLQKANASAENESERLLQLARAQGMNTDIRRSIFVVLMSSDDYVDACDRLSQLTLTEQQQREIVRVLVHCCGNVRPFLQTLTPVQAQGSELPQEKAYNPYYSLVGQRLLATSHAHRITAQFSLWDFLRSIGETGIGQRGGESFDSTVTVSTSRTRNLAKFYGWLIVRGSLSISVLRPIDFSLLHSPTLVLLDTLFYDVFTNSQGTTPILSRTGFTALWQRGDVNFPGKQTYDKAPIVETFMPAVRDASLGRGLVVYLGKFIKRKVGQGVEEGERRFFTWAVGIARDVLEVGSTAVGEKDWEE